MHTETAYKLCIFYENRARNAPLRGVYMRHFDQISVKISVLGSYTLIVAPMGVKFDVEEGTFGPLLHAKIYPYWCNVPPLWGEKLSHFDSCLPGKPELAISASVFFHNLLWKRTFHG